MGVVKVTNLAKFYTLLLLSKGSRHGYEIMKELNSMLGKNVSASLVYPFLNTLKKHRYITVKEREERDKKTYALTSQGKQFVKGLIDRFGDAIDAAIESKLISCIHCGCRIYSGSHTEKIKGKKLHFCCIRCAESYKNMR
jgi:DNA-binding PadR family transcriptional regulator